MGEWVGELKKVGEWVGELKEVGEWVSEWVGDRVGEF